MAVGYSDISSGTDSLGAQIYYDGLSRFIMECQTPMTISIQGDWGTGKTTALNLIEKKIEGKNSYVLWFRTWQYSKFGIEDNMMLVLLNNLYEKLEELAKTKKIKNPNKKIPILQGVRETIATVADSTLGSAVAEKASGVFDVLVGADKVTSVSKQIEETKNSMQELIDSILVGDERVVVFVDDLDRLEPKVAVDLLEGIKNFLDCNKCVFVLAVDSGVIYQGVRSKYGDEFGEEKAKKFFDKIIQVPFSLPVNQYDINTFLGQFISTDNPYINEYESITKKYLKNNPRAIKRAFNLLKLYEFIIPGLSDGDERDRFCLFTILNLQLSNEKKYSDMVIRAKNGEEIANVLGEELDDLSRSLSFLLVGNNDSEELRIEKEEHASRFIELLIGAAKASGKEEAIDEDINESLNGTTQNNEQVVRETSPKEGDQSSIIEELIQRLEIHAYRKDVVNKNQINFWGKAEKEGISGNKVCSIRKDEKTSNIVIYKAVADLKKPEHVGVVDKSEKKEIAEGEIGYYYSRDHITFVDISEKTNRSLLFDLMQFYEVL